jgi:hypothetical protein
MFDYLYNIIFNLYYKFLYYGSNNKRNGFGKQSYFFSNEIYEGNFVNDKRHGNGKLIENNGDTYDGNFENDKKHGFGILISPNYFKYEGGFENDKISGNGKFIWFTNGNMYEGGFINGKQYGNGKYTLSNGDFYEGYFNGSIKNGIFILKTLNGDIYEEMYCNNELEYSTKINESIKVTIKCPKCRQFNELNIDENTSYDCSEYPCCICFINKANVYYPKCKHMIVCNFCTKKLQILV